MGFGEGRNGWGFLLNKTHCLKAIKYFVTNSSVIDGGRVLTEVVVVVVLVLVMLVVEVVLVGEVVVGIGVGGGIG